MKKEEILDFVKKQGFCYLATEESGQPRVRAMGILKVDDKGIIFQTSDVKDLWGQIEKNRRVELCFNDFQNGIQLRIEGIAQEIDDDSLRREALELRPFLKPLVEEKGLRTIKLFRITKGRAHVWTRERNFEPKEWIEIF